MGLIQTPKVGKPPRSSDLVSKGEAHVQTLISLGIEAMYALPQAAFQEIIVLTFSIAQDYVQHGLTSGVASLRSCSSRKNSGAHLSRRDDDERTNLPQQRSHL